MVKAFLRIGMSAVLGATMALPFAARVHAAPITTTADLGLDTNFTSQVGLGDNDLQDTIAQLINVALGFLGIVAVIIILFGGFKWMTAGGNDEKVGEAKRLIIAGIIGLAIILSAYAITTFVLTSLISATT